MPTTVPSSSPSALAALHGFFKPQSPALVVVVLSVWMALIGNVPLWQKVWTIQPAGTATGWWMAGFAVLLAGGCALLLSLLAWPRVFKPLAAMLLVVSAVNSYFMWQYGVVMDGTMLANALHTNTREAGDLLTWRLLGVLLVVALPPLIWLFKTPVRWRSWGGQLWRNTWGVLLSLVVIVASTLTIYQGLASLMRNHTSVRYLINPLNTVHASGWLMAQAFKGARQPLQALGTDAQLGASYSAQPRPPLLLLVVGETARADHFSMGGYGRDTTPRLAGRLAQGDLAYFSQVESCGTNTQVSVPCLFSHLSRTEGGNQPPTHENLLDVLQRAGLAVLWVDNQSGCKDVCARVPNVETSNAKHPTLCQGGECFDEVMLAGLEQRIEALEPARRAKGVVLVFHQMGSHGPAYYKRTPAARKVFLPECTSATLSECKPGELVNAYDNTIAYTDHFLDQSIQLLEQQNKAGRFDTGLLYVSDHGESLGENGLYLHGLPFALAPKAQTHVPMVAWLSAPLQQRSGRPVTCLKQRKDAPLSHANYFHTVLGLMDVKTEAYRAERDAFARCR